jgi:hypothetical protein
MSERQDAAVRYARAGWPVFPAKADMKEPATRHGVLDAESDARTVARWWARHPDANVAIATGKPGPTVLDVDVAHGKPGPASLNHAVRAGLVPSPMAAVRTPSGGSHLYYSGDEQRNGSLPAQGLDLRGQGGYVIAPPSTVGGRPYFVVSHSAQPASIDFAAIRDHLQPQPESRSRQPRTGYQGAARLADWVADLPEGNRNAGTFWAACRAVEHGDSETLAAIARAAVSTGLDHRAVDKTIASARRTASPKAQADREAAG